MPKYTEVSVGRKLTSNISTKKTCIIYKYMQTDKISQMEINKLLFNINIPSKMC